jgi:nucleoside-diphosphate kinase
MTSLSHPKLERTFMMIKPDGVARGLTGDVLQRVERTGLRIAGLKMLRASKEHVSAFYPSDAAWIARVGSKTLATYEKFGYDAIAELGTKDPFQIGTQVRSWLMDFMTSGPVVPVVIQGVHAVAKVRKLAGATMPTDAEFGTIRGDFSFDSAAAANRDKRAVFNVVHASETIEEAESEISHWFRPDELATYVTASELVMLPAPPSR